MSTVKSSTKLNGMFAFVFHDRKQNQWIVGTLALSLLFSKVGDQLILLLTLGYLSPP